MTDRPGERRLRGDRIEGLAARHLAAEGLAILERNWRTRSGELDIVAREGETLVAVEVRSRRTGSPIDAAMTLTPAKARRVVRAMRAWLGARGLDDVAVRFDAVLVETDADGEPLSFRWERDFFDADVR